MWGWLSGNAIALLALFVSISVAVGNLVGHIQRLPSADWILEEAILGMPDETWHGPAPGRFLFRNAGNGTAYRTTVERKTGSDEFLTFANQVQRTIGPDGRVEAVGPGTIDAIGRKEKIQFSSGDGMLFNTDLVVRIIWYHRPGSKHPKERTFVMQDEQLNLMPRWVSASSAELQLGA